MLRRQGYGDGVVKAVTAAFNLLMIDESGRGGLRTGSELNYHNTPCNEPGKYFFFMIGCAVFGLFDIVILLMIMTTTTIARHHSKSPDNLKTPK